MPPVTPVNAPVVASMVAFEVSLLLHAPDGVLHARVAVTHGQILVVPVIDANAPFTVTTVVEKQVALD